MIVMRTLSYLLLTGAAVSMAAAPLAAQAQQNAAAEASADEGNVLGIPQDVTLLGQADPNVRTATAKVNGRVITGTDIDHRVALVTAASETQLPPEELARLRQQVLRNLIDETLQIQAAATQELPVSAEQVEQRYAQLAAQNFGSNPTAMDDYLKQIGSSANSLKRQIEGELAWRALVGRNVSPFVNVSAEEVSETLERMEEAKGTEEYRLGEIYLAATAENRASVEQTARQIMEQLRQGGSFVGFARQYSQASTAVVGGDLGFVRLAQLPSELSSAAVNMQPGQLAGPIEVAGGLSILYLIDKRQVLMADPRDAILSLKQISLNFPSGITEAEARSQLGRFTLGVEAMKGCGAAEEMSPALGASVVTNDQVRVRSLPDQLQGLLLDLQIGQSTPPFGSIEEGIRVLMLCGRDDPESTAGPDFEQVMAQLEDDRINKRAQRYLRDLRNDAYIEYN